VKRYLVGLLGRVERKKNIEQLAKRLGEDAYSEVLLAEDSGERRPWQWACLGLAADPEKGMSRWLLIRRNSEDPEDIAFYQAYGPGRSACRNPPGVWAAGNLPR
jgi:hypothetical protein